MPPILDAARTSGAYLHGAIAQRGYGKTSHLVRVYVETLRQLGAVGFVHDISGRTVQYPGGVAWNVEAFRRRRFQPGEVRSVVFRGERVSANDVAALGWEPASVLPAGAARPPTVTVLDEVRYVSDGRSPPHIARREVPFVFDLATLGRRRNANLLFTGQLLIHIPVELCALATTLALGFSAPVVHDYMTDRLKIPAAVVAQTGSLKRGEFLLYLPERGTTDGLIYGPTW